MTASTAISIAKNVLPIAAPFLIPYFIRKWTEWTCRESVEPKPRRPLKQYHVIVMLVLILLGIIQLGFALYFLSSNVFLKTKTSIFHSIETISRRLLVGGGMTEHSRELLEKLGTLKDRVVYASYGEGPLLSCQFCSLDKPESLKIYVTPTIVFPYLVNGGVIALATSADPSLSTLRAPTTFLILFLAAYDLYSVLVFNIMQNMNPKSETKWLIWNIRRNSSSILAVLDVTVAIMIYFYATGILGKPPFISEHQQITRDFESVESNLSLVTHKARSINLVYGAMASDEELTQQAVSFWNELRTEEDIISQDVDFRRVLEHAAMEYNIEKLNEEAKSFARALIVAAKRNRV
ncbi:hypothetical protein V1511DRAFT_490752 [Dipodascopsis uninucleata]